jgi:hypothetical protein
MGTLREDGLLRGESNICMRIHYQIFCFMGAIFFCTNFLQKFWDKMK